MKRNVLLFLILFALFCARYFWFVYHNQNKSYNDLLGKKTQLAGVVISEVSEKENSTRFVLKTEKARVLVSGDKYLKINYGDKVQVEGKIEAPENFANENGRVFDYKNYLAKDKIFYTVSFAKVSSLGINEGNIFYKYIYKFKNTFIASLNKNISFPESTLASGLVVAGKQSLPKKIQEDFIKTGTSQVVVLSGYNVTIVSEALISLLFFLPRGVALYGAGFGIILFAIAAGAGASVVRACIMALIAISGKLLRRDYDVGRALFVSAFLMLLVNPMLLFYDASFQLSFLATYGLIYFSPIFKSKFTFITDKYNLREVFSATVATQIFVTPFILYLTGNFSIVAIPANLSLFLLTPIAMFLSFFAGAVGLVSNILALPFGFFAYIPLKIMLTLVSIFSSIPYANITISVFPFWLCGVCYVYLIFLIWKFYRNNESQHSNPRL